MVSNSSSDRYLQILSRGSPWLLPFALPTVRTSFAKALLGIVSAASLNLSLVCPAISITPEDAQKKLEVIAVFALVNERGEFYEVSLDETIVVPGYLKASTAQKQLDNLLNTKKELKGTIVAFSLNLFNKKVAQLLKLAESKGINMKSTIVVEQPDMVKAREILKSEGRSDSEIEKGLRVPIFFAEPMLLGKTSAGMRQVFFASYSQLREALEALPEEKRKGIKERVADLDVVLDVIKNTDEDIYAFAATRDYVTLRDSYLESQQKGKD